MNSLQHIAAFTGDRQMTTALQQAMLRKIARDEFTAVNGSEPESNEEVAYIWAANIIETAQDKGVFTSLLNAGLVGHCEDGRESTVWLTDEGFAEYKRTASVTA